MFLLGFSNRWSGSVIQGGMKVTTANFYLNNAHHFIEYMRQTPPRSSRLTQRQFGTITRELKMGLKSQVVVHQMATKCANVSHLP